ncbi:MAG: pilus assembly FimT family protein [Opitutales bacterium]
MILATGNRSFDRCSGFTLIEILMVIALIALASSVVIVNFTALADRGDTISPEEVLSAAIRRARFIAAAERIITELYYDDETGTLRIDPSGEQFAINEDFGPGGRGTISFYLIAPSIGLRRLPNPNEASLETKSVAFAPDRSSSPFVAEIDNGQGNPTRLRFDPFSSVVRTDK